MTSSSVWSIRFGTLFLSLVLCAGVPAEGQPAGGQPGVAPPSDVLLRAMQDELSRSIGELQLEALQTPYFIEYAVVDTESTVLEATFGAGVRRNQSRMRSLRVDVRVGSHELDSSEFLGMQSLFSMSAFPRSLVQEDDYDALRHELWLATDAAYKQALEQLAQKQAFVQNRVQEEQVPDFSTEAATVLIEPAEEDAFDESVWQETVRRLSEVFREHPAIKESSVTFHVESSTKYLVNSDGSMVRQPASLAALYARAATQAPDGMLLKHFVPFYDRAIEDLPSEAEMEAAVRTMASQLTALATAPVLEDYIGPVLVSGQASSELFGQVLAPQLSGHRPPLLENEAMAAAMVAMMPSSDLANRLNRRVLPTSFDVVDDPTKEAFAGESLIGGYAVDDQGVPAQPVTLIEDGVLQTLLMSRRPRKDIPQSNGHGRAGAFGSPTAQLGNIFVRADDALSVEELKDELIGMAEDEGLAYGILVSALDNPGITGADMSSMLLMMRGGQSRPQLTSPILAYKVYVADGRQELVRGLSFQDVSVRSLRDIVASGDDYYVNNRLGPGGGGPFGAFVPPGLGGPGGQGIPSAVIAPSVLFEELEIRRMSGPQQTPALMEHPYFDQK